MSRMPIIGVTACTKQIGLHAFHISGDKYVRAVALAAKGLPLILPSLAELLDPAEIIDGLDGLLFTGSPSNIEPHHYQGPADGPGTPHDPQRDHTTLPLLRAAVAAGVPVLGICRGFQELNVAFGGSLHQKVHETGNLAVYWPVWAWHPRFRSTLSMVRASHVWLQACVSRLWPQTV